MIKSKKIISIVAAATLSLSALAFGGCGKVEYKGEEMDGYVSADAVSSNGGFAVEKGNYVYFINGKEENTAENTYGDVVKGALMRISKDDLAKGNGSAAKVVVPSLFVSGSFDSGIYIYGDYVYYATPTADKDNDGQVANSSLDFKRAKLDGSEAPMGGKDEYFFRLSSNTVKYRFVEDNDVVYCMYEEDGALKSYNTETKETTVLVKGASAYFYDTQDLASPVVYYTMSVSQDVDKTTPTSQAYNQIFAVSAGNTVSVDSAKAAYVAKNSAGTEVASYDFDEEFLKKQKDASDEKKDKYDLSDYTTYPYVNLGELVLDGIGSMHAFPGHVVTTEAQEEAKASATEFGYTYALQQQANGGLYFTRDLVNKVSAENEKAKLCYIPNARTDWNAITGNAQGKTQIVSTDTTSASATALYSIEEGVHSYVYLTETALKRTTTDETGKATKTVTLKHNLSSVTLWKLEGDYLYYYGDGTNGKNLARINYKGTQDNYGFNEKDNKDEYQPITLSLVDWSDAWYKPEFFTVKNGDGEESVLLYPNAQSYGVGGTSYNYVYSVKVGSTEQIKARNEAIEEVNDEIDSYSSNTALQNLMKCYFRTGGAASFDADEEVKALYTSYQVKTFEEFKGFFAKDGKFEGKMESDFITLLGKVSEKDAEAMEADWANSLLLVEEEGEEGGLKTWHIVLIVVGSVVVVALAVAIPVIIVCVKKKKRKKLEAESIVNAYKRKKLDTTDDKSIDVYADTDVEPETKAEEAPESEAPAEETPVEEASTEEDKDDSTEA